MSAPMSKDLKTIEDVNTKVTAFENDLAALETRVAQHRIAAAARLWQFRTTARAQQRKRKQSVDSAAPSATAPVEPTALIGALAGAVCGVRAVAYRLRMDTHWVDEGLMQALFKLDNVFGDDSVRSKRKEQVARIKVLITRAEALSKCVHRIDTLLQRMPPTATPAAAAAAPTASSTSAAPADTKSDVKGGDYSDRSGATTSSGSSAATVPMEEVTAPALPTAPTTTAPMDHTDRKHSATPSRAVSPTQPSPTRLEAAPRPTTPPAAATKSSASAAAPPVPGEADGAGDSLISAAVKAQWPRLRPEFESRSVNGALRLSADLSGVAADDLSVTLNADNTVLTVRGLLRPVPPRKRLVRRARPARSRTAWWFMNAYDDDEPAEEEEEVYEEADEQPYGWFEEQFALPPRLNIDASRAERVFQNGTLTILLPRARPPSPPSPPKPSVAHARPQRFAPQPARRAMFNPFFGGGGWF